jgi:hypothetical protein
MIYSQCSYPSYLFAETSGGIDTQNVGGRIGKIYNGRGAGRSA